MKIQKICYVNTIYSLFLFLLINSEDYQETFYFFGDEVPNDIIIKFKNHVVLKKEFKKRGKDFQKYFFFKKLYKILEKNNLFDKEIYLQDHLKFSNFFLNNIENCYLLEDGLMSYDEKLLTKEIKRIIKTKFFKSIKNKIIQKIKTEEKIYGLSDKITKIYLTGISEIPEIIKNKVELINIKEQWENLSEDKKAKILGIFNIDESNFNKIEKTDNKILLITQPLSEDNIVAEEEKIKIYKEIIDKYSNKNIIIKPHPREKTNYQEIFPNIEMIKGKFPLEILMFLGIEFKEVITIFSTAALNFKGITNVNFLGTENYFNLKEKAGEIKSNYYKI